MANDEVLAKALVMSELKRDGQIGHTEKNEFYLKSIKGKTILDIGADAPLYKVSDKVPDVNSFIRGRGVLGGAEIEFKAADCEIVPFDENGNITIIGLREYGAAIGAVVLNDAGSNKKGVYLIYGDDKNNVSYIEFAETLHPIDPKFLPGVCLPVVELGTVPTEGYTPSAETIAQLDAVSVLDAPIVVKFVGALDTTYTLTMNKASMKIDGIDASVYGGITNIANVDNYELNIVGVQTQWEVVVSKVSGS